MAHRIDTENPRFLLVTSLLLLAITVVGAVDLMLDVPMRDPFHLVVELAFISLCLGTAAYLLRGWRRACRSLSSVRQALERRQEERDEWRARAQQILQGLGEAIDGQLKRWRLTEAERETAVMLLKGYSHKEIAALSGRSERTVRQHAVAVYRKSGLSGRAELSAFFLEDLLLPLDDPRPATTTASR
ncbi:MAG: helix-turn-helix domain-containing protein [Acidobacteriota bacterium]|jgi:DNA-binding CsgD family transcriptional regulator